MRFLGLHIFQTSTYRSTTRILNLQRKRTLFDHPNHGTTTSAHHHRHQHLPNPTTTLIVPIPKMQLFSNTTTTTANPSSLHDLTNLLTRTQALRAQLASSSHAARLSDSNIKSYIEDCKPRVVLIRCYWMVGLQVGCAQYMEEKVDMLAEPLSEVELEKQEKRVEYLMGWVKERQEGRGAGGEEKGEEGQGEGRVVVLKGGDGA